MSYVPVTLPRGKGNTNNPCVHLHDYHLSTSHQPAISSSSLSVSDTETERAI